jgi:tetratricopeptide (TPR) repeat protein
MILKKAKEISIIIEFSIILFSICIFPQTLENVAYQKADSIHETQQRIKAFKNFISTYPDSQNKTNALIELFSLYLKDVKVKTALNYAAQAIKSAPEQLKIDILDEVAYSLAQKKVGLDTAALYAQRAITASSINHAYMLKYEGMSLETEALIMYDLQKADSAVTIEKKALRIDKDNPAYLSNLAIYQEAAGYRSEAIKSAAKAILLGNTNEALTNLNNWIEKEIPNKNEQGKIRINIADSTLKYLFDKSKMENRYCVNSTAAAFLALIKVNLEQADKWIRESLNSLNDNSLIPDRVLITKNYGLVLFSEGKNEEALNVLNSVKNFADPLNENFWFTLGKIYEKNDEFPKALNSYINGYIVFRFLSIQSAIRELCAKNDINQNKIESFIIQDSKEFSSIEPGNYEGKNIKGNVVLAELFTGADDHESLSVDSAFDYLSEYYTRSELAILVYHQHFPTPDPMTNPDSFKRYQYYVHRGHLAIPTAIIQGTSRISGGGPNEFIKSKFEALKYTVEKYLDKNTNVKIAGFLKHIDDSIYVNLQIDKESDTPDSIYLHIALAEKSIDYAGDNGIKKHIFVVRNLYGGPTGIPLKLNKGNSNVSTTFDINEIETGISNYLLDPTKDPSWSITVKMRWKQWLGTLDRNNLAVVAWVQNDKTQEVSQSIYLDVPADN